MAGLKMNIEFPTRLCEVKGELGYFHRWEQWSNVVDAALFVEVIQADKSGKFMGSLNSKMVFAVLIRHPSNSAMRRMPISVRL